MIRPDLAKQKSVFDLPELRHNVDLILDKCEDQLISADRSLKHHKNKKEVLLELVKHENVSLDLSEGAFDGR